MTQKNKKSLTAPGSSNLEIACPKTYEFRLLLFLAGITSFQDRCMIGGWFMGSNLSQGI
jgi:hypothetical protein